MSDFIYIGLATKGVLLYNSNKGTCFHCFPCYSVLYCLTTSLGVACTLYRLNTYHCPLCHGEKCKIRFSNACVRDVNKCVVSCRKSHLDLCQVWSWIPTDILSKWTPYLSHRISCNTTSWVWIVHTIRYTCWGVPDLHRSVRLLLEELVKWNTVWPSACYSRSRSELWALYPTRPPVQS